MAEWSGAGHLLNCNDVWMVGQLSSWQTVTTNVGSPEKLCTLSKKAVARRRLRICDSQCVMYEDVHNISELVYLHSGSTM